METSTNVTTRTRRFTNTAPTNPLFYNDPNAGSFRKRFYRAFQYP